MSSSLIQGISQVSVTVNNIPQALAFYGEVLGLPLLFSSDSMALVECGSVRLILSVPERPEFDHPGSVLYFSVGNIHDAYQEFLRKGVEFRDEPHVITEMQGVRTWMVFFYDPDRNLHALTSEENIGE
ncbi:VOC family protein [Paenibacillus physcomitrellae]|uniref:VOC domain-containing protein n=1 Tax=Paenibacillus physcomitrellae TaxID=1619311 RepID=A0ABQ1FXE2_9BACL|nr:VOC family protein [Paenibacillus physcomitrellae]GGA33314.1 hypothetical protein GCM10010917_18080 [Paenibacillus physcomitrellae]